MPVSCPRIVRTSRQSRARGVALIESLVALLVFAVGILGAVGMQTAMLREQGAMKARADAAMLAGELIGLMWGDYDNIVTQNKLSNYLLTNANSCSAIACKDWLIKVKKALPAGEATIAADDASGIATITIAWTLPTNVRHSYVTQATFR